MEFKTHFEVIPASNEDVKLYYKTAAKKINALLVKYGIRNSKGKCEQISSEQLQSLLSFDGFFQATPLKTMFFDQKQQFIPAEIIYV